MGHGIRKVKSTVLRDGGQFYLPLDPFAKPTIEHALLTILYPTSERTLTGPQGCQARINIMLSFSSDTQKFQ